MTQAALDSSSRRPGPKITDDAFIQAGDLIIIFAVSLCVDCLLRQQAANRTSWAQLFGLISSILQSRDKTPIPLTVTSGEHVSNMFGHFRHDDMIGMPYGSKVSSDCSMFPFSL